MSDEYPKSDSRLSGLAERIRRLAEAFVETDLVRLRVVDANDDSIELQKAAVPAVRAASAGSGPAADGEVATPAHLESIKSDLVGIFHLSRPAPAEGEVLAGDRELAYVEALGIRNPVRSLGGGRLVSVRVTEGEPVEYGQVLFEIDRG